MTPRPPISGWLRDRLPGGVLARWPLRVVGGRVPALKPAEKVA